MTLNPRVGGLIVAALAVVAASAGLEWWSVSGMVAGLSAPGMLTGIAGASIVFALIWALENNRAALRASAYTALLAVAELIVGIALILAFAAIAVRLLPARIMLTLFSGGAATDLLVFSFIGLGTLVAARNWYRYTQQKERAMHAGIDAAQASAKVAQQDRMLALRELEVLRAQVEPHFLWNTLAHVQFLIQKNSSQAGPMVTHLIDYLRATVPQARGDITTLGSEFDSAQAYLELMKIRMGERLTISVDLPDNLRGVPFAPFLVQTLVENAVKHGIEPKVGPVSVSVRGSAPDGLLGDIVIDVVDNGIGLSVAPATKGTGLGLRSVRERVQALYGGDATLSVSDAPGGGVISRIRVAPRLKGSVT